MRAVIVLALAGMACSQQKSSNLESADAKVRERTANVTPGPSPSMPSDSGETQTDYGNQHVVYGNFIFYHNAATGNPTPSPGYACIQNHQQTIDNTPTFKAEKIGQCPGGVIDYYKYTWKARRK